MTKTPNHVCVVNGAGFRAPAQVGLKEAQEAKEKGKVSLPWVLIPKSLQRGFFYDGGRPAGESSCQEVDGQRVGETFDNVGFVEESSFRTSSVRA